jgi:hypothetical protein
MPLPTSVPETAESAFQRVLGTAQSVSSNLRGVGDLIASGGPVTMDNLIGLYQALNASQGVGLSIQSVEGLSDYAKEKLGASYDINAEFMKSIVACKAVTDWLLANMPNDGNGGFVGWQHQADGTIVRRTVDLATLGPLAALIAAALATFA